jgi:predicted HTH domain antitoxin
MKEFTMSGVALELDSDLAEVLRPLADRPLNSFVKELAVLELYRRRLVSSGKAAELLEMKRFEFVRYASRLGIPFLDMSQDEFEAELREIKALQ